MKGTFPSVICIDYGDNEEAYIQYWIIMKEINNIIELEEVSIKLQAVCSSTHVPTGSWVEALFRHSEMQVIKGNIEEAIKTLKRI
jgi:hypothetical protein